MLEDIYNSQSTIYQLRNGALGNYIDDFTSYFLNQGYSPRQAVSRLGIISKLNVWLSNQRIPLNRFSDEQINRFIIYRKTMISNFYRRGDGKLLSLFITFLRNEGVIPQKETQVSERQDIEIFIQQYANFLKDEKGLSDVTIKRNCCIIDKFLLTRFDKQVLCFNQLKQKDLLNYIIQCHQHYSTKTMQVIISGLRSMLQYLVMTGEIKQGLAQGIPSIACSRAAHLPDFLTHTEVKQLLTSCNRQTAVGSRNYAILLLLIRLGLRASEVINLSLDDIDWHYGVVQIDGKGGKQRTLPLPKDNGEALVDYLKNWRPSCAYRQLFIRNRAPLQPLHNASNISSIVRRALIKSRLSPKIYGAHLLRYTAATESLSQGATLHEIADLLGHSSEDTTALYIKIDVTRLKELALPWPQA